MKRFFEYLKPFSPMVITVMLLVLLQSLAELALPSLMADIVDKGIARGDTALIWRIGGRMLVVALGGTVCAIMAGYLSARVSAGYGKGLRDRVFTHATSLSVHEFDKVGTSSLITRTTNDINQVQAVVLMSLRMVIMTPMMFIGGIVMAVSKDPRLSLMLVAVLPVIAIGIYVVSKKGLPLFKAMQQKLDRLNLVLREGLTGVRVIRAFNRIDYEARRFDEANKDLTGTAVRVNRIMAALMPMLTLTLNFMTIAIIWIGSHRIDAGYLEVGGLMAFIQYAMRILMSLIMVSMIFVMLPRASASASRISEVLDSVPEMDMGGMDATDIATRHMDTAGIDMGKLATTGMDTAEMGTADIDMGKLATTGMDTAEMGTADIDMGKLAATAMDTAATGTADTATAGADTSGATLSQDAGCHMPDMPVLNALRGTVEFRNVTFSYPGAEKPALSQVSFKAKPGEITAIIGGTGSGKSTLISLIPRFHDVDSGEILIDGVNIRELPYEDLRARIGLVPQKAVLFSGSVADNIRYGKDDATDEEVRYAAEIAQALDFVNQMPDGFDSYIAQGGTNVSGGQKQRLCIARALVRRPKIYIFDDSFSALDFKTDARLRSALREQITDATMFLVAQRVSTVLDADRILVLDEGRIVGNGTHKGLLKDCSVYREIVLSQLSEEEVA